MTEKLIYGFICILMGSFIGYKIGYERGYDCVMKIWKGDNK